MIVLVLILIILVAVFYHQVSEKKRYKNEVYLNNLQIISEFIEVVSSLKGYVTWVKRDKIKSKYKTVGVFFNGKTNFYRKEECVKKFNKIFNNFDDYIIDYNKNYVDSEKERLKQYFNNIENKSLDNQQRTAIVTDEYSNLIIAGAGSGKTLTILGKVKYLIEEKNINPKDILLLSFTKKTVEELNERLKKMKISTQATTFHKLGYDIIKKFHQNPPTVTNENTLSNVIKKYLNKEILDDSVALGSFIEYVACYMNVPEEYKNYNSLGEKIDNEKGIDFETLKSKCEPLNKVSTRSLDTMKGERVKSVEELIIANFLFLNGIEYIYERAYPYEETVYQPDFFLPGYEIYIEHFGVDENNRAKWLTSFNEQKYIDGMAWKREIHKKHGTKLLETYSYYNRDNILLEKLKEMLVNEDVIFSPKDAKTIYTKVSENDKRLGKEINKLIETFINLSKSRQLDRNSLTSLFLEETPVHNNFMAKRQEMFLSFVLPIVEKYNTTLKANVEIDFNDMINQATNDILTNQPQYPYDYIIIDEYQDISFSRFNLIKTIRDLSGARLICVGDDWQSIYRFAGSDISLFSNFEKYVGKYEKLLIERTYRNSEPLIEITSKFIQKNPKQIAKSPKSTKEPIIDPIRFIYYEVDEIEDVFTNEIRRIVNNYGDKSILVLGRHSFDINDLIRKTQNNRVKFFERTGNLEVSGFENIDIRFLTVHKSKGMEADNVIILNLRNHLLGFPNKMTDDPVLSPLLSVREEYKFAEERRLFYVALTRTKNEVSILIPPQISLFAEELLTDNNYLLTHSNGNFNTTTCPYCKTGKLVIRRNSSNDSQFLGCTHYPICNQTFNNIEILQNEILCPKCKSGFMVKRNGRYGNFLGCTNYPNCRNTINLQ